MKQVPDHGCGCQAESVLFVCVGTAPLYFRRVSALHLIHNKAVYPVCGTSHREQQSWKSILDIFIIGHPCKHIYVCPGDVFVCLKDGAVGVGSSSS